MNEKTNFCQSFPWKLKIKWQDLEGIVTLDADRRAVIELSERNNHTPYADHFVSFLVKIVSKTNGTITSKLFLFSDYLDIRKRVDARPDFKTNGFHAWHGTEWYIAIPKDTTPLVEAIENWIEAWK